jgi:hypothetical protein
MSITYRKTKQGEWVAYGPRAEFPADYYQGKIITVVKKDGTARQEMLTGLGKVFTVDGTAMVYGYLDKDFTAPAPAAAVPAPRAASRPAHRAHSRMCGNCGERRATTTATDLSGFTGEVCGTCARSGALSFA